MRPWRVTCQTHRGSCRAWWGRDPSTRRVLGQAGRVAISLVLRSPGRQLGQGSLGLARPECLPWQPCPALPTHVDLVLLQQVAAETLGLVTHTEAVPEVFGAAPPNVETCSGETLQLDDLQEPLEGRLAWCRRKGPCLGQALGPPALRLGVQLLHAQAAPLKDHAPFSPGPSCCCPPSILPVLSNTVSAARAVGQGECPCGVCVGPPAPSPFLRKGLVETSQPLAAGGGSISHTCLGPLQLQDDWGSPRSCCPQKFPPPQRSCKGQAQVTHSYGGGRAPWAGLAVGPALSSPPRDLPLHREVEAASSPPPRKDLCGPEATVTLVRQSSSPEAPWLPSGQAGRQAAGSAEQKRPCRELRPGVRPPGS